MEEKRCGNCGGQMHFLKRENVQLGKYGFFFGDWSNLFAGAQDLEFWVCPQCRKLDFYVPEDSVSESSDMERVMWTEGTADGMAQITCPVCGTEHDMDDPKCPCCGAKNSIRAISPRL